MPPDSSVTRAPATAIPPGRDTSTTIRSETTVDGRPGSWLMFGLRGGAPPSGGFARVVVSVKWSMLARVPGPAERLAIVATISE